MSSAVVQQQAAATPRVRAQLLGVAAAVVAMLAFAFLVPPLAGLPVAGQRAIAILIFAVMLWVTEAVDTTVSALLIAVAIILLVGTAPSLEDPARLVGITRARDWAIAGFANNAVVLVGAALIFAVAVSATGSTAASRWPRSRASGRARARCSAARSRSASCSPSSCPPPRHGYRPWCRLCSASSPPSASHANRGCRRC